jgi:hypothetical protein
MAQAAVAATTAAPPQAAPVAVAAASEKPAKPRKTMSDETKQKLADVCTRYPRIEIVCVSEDLYSDRAIRAALRRLKKRKRRK